jgi:DNA repair exonuclease SbcCD nuclease subunit
MRIAHLADLHLGRKSRGDTNGAGRLNSFRQGITKLTQQSPDVIVLAGDVFDSPGVDLAIVEEAAKALVRASTAGNTPVVLIPGNHDPSNSDRLWNAFRTRLGAHSSVRVVLDPEAIALAQHETIVEAYPCETRYSPESPWAEQLDVPDDSEEWIRLVVAHGTLQGGPVPEGESEAYPFTKSELDNLGANYVALGHFHCVYPAWQGGDRIERSFCYSGTHEPDEFDQDSGWAIIATLEKGKPTHLRRMRLGNREWKAVDISTPADLEGLDHLRMTVESESGDPRNYVIRLRLGPEARLSVTEVEKLDAVEASLLALGAYVERQGELAAHVNVESLDLSALPSGAVRQALLDLQDELAETTDNRRREILTAALQLGWQRLSE